MLYYNVEKDDKGIYLVEECYDRRYLLKTESAFSQTNGYIGVRASFDSKVLEENRGMFAAGLYEKPYSDEVAELVNCPDLTEFKITIDDEMFSIDTCKLLKYRRALNVMTGELTILLICELNNGKQVEIVSRRFASFHDCHLLCQRLVITPLNHNVKVNVVTGINGQITNNGVSEFSKINCRVYSKSIMSMDGYLTKDKLTILSNCVSDSHLERDPQFFLRPRSVFEKLNLTAEMGKKIIFSKYSYIEVSDKNNIFDISKMIRLLKSYTKEGYDSLFLKHKNYMNAIWHYAKINIKGVTLKEEGAICFAQYHLLGMAPKNGSDVSVGAKGLTGDGYKGHVFWDTELFILPFYLYTFPEISKNLLKFRYKGIKGAEKKAEDYGYLGAMYPWEVAKDGYEETPLYAALNIYTGKANKVWSGIKEHHVTADIIYALYKYYSLTHDENFMDDYGYEIIIKAAIFWLSRSFYSNEKERYEILDIIGPDEYTEHVDNNAYSNYMAHFCVKTAWEMINNLKKLKPDKWAILNKKFGIDNWMNKWRDFLDKLYLPLANENNIIPQDDTFLSKKILKNINYYKNNQEKQSILLDYSRDEIVDMQVLKQADVVMLLNLFPNAFSEEIIKDNVIFYEKRTIHDSSLSYCVHSQACAHIDELNMSWDFFVKSLEIDLNDNPYGSTDGIHSAALGGIWNCIILGFAGVSHEYDILEISPHLPQNWSAIEFYINIQGIYINVNIDGNKGFIGLKCQGNVTPDIKVKVYNNIYELKNSMEIPLSRNV